MRWFFALMIVAWLSGCVQRPTGPVQTIDAKQVQQKIQALGVRDDALPSQEQAAAWIYAHFQQVVPELIAGLDDPSRRVSNACLGIVLGEAYAGPEFSDALLRIAADPEHLLNAPATLALTRPPFVSDARAKPILEAAWNDAKRFPDPEDRARIAGAIGHAPEAVAILLPYLVLPTQESRYRLIQRIRQVGALRCPDAAPRLSELAKAQLWDVAREAHLALDKADPIGHSLTQDQRTFLEQIEYAPKEGTDSYNQRIKDLAPLNRAQVLPFVIQILRSDLPQPALEILSVWRESAVLPDVWRLAVENRYTIREKAVAAYLAIAENDRSEKAVLGLLHPEDSDHNEPILRGIAGASIPDERKVAIFQKAGTILTGANRWQVRASIRDGQFGLLCKLMGEETDVNELSAYATSAMESKDVRFIPPLRRAVKILADTARSPRSDNREIECGAVILDAASDYGMKDVTAEVIELSKVPSLRIRLSAAGFMARVNAQGDALRLLYEQLGKESDLKSGFAPGWTAAALLAGIPVQDEADRSRREDAVLAVLGSAFENCTLRLLTACGREKSVKALLPVLEDGDVPRAVFAAWILAQLPDKAASQKALRRFAIYGMFHREFGQLINDLHISFEIAPDIYLYQQLGEGAGAEHAQPILIPDDLLVVQRLSHSEQAFALRTYRYRFWTTPDSGVAGVVGPSRWWPLPLDETYVPLLRVIAAEDPWLNCAVLKDKKVAHFPYRRAAAQMIARITKANCDYTGLAMEPLDSAAFPAGPYAEQNRRIAAFCLDTFRKTSCPCSPSAWNYARREWLRRTCSSLCEEFGEEFRREFKAEAERRGILPELAQTIALE